MGTKSCMKIHISDGLYRRIQAAARADSRSLANWAEVQCRAALTGKKSLKPAPATREGDGKAAVRDLYFGEDVKGRIQAEAGRLGMNTSGWVRAALENALS